MKLKCKFIFLNIKRLFNILRFRIIDKVMPKLSHNNKAIVFSTIKVICTYLEFIDTELSLAIQVKLRPPISKFKNAKHSKIF